MRLDLTAPIAEVTVYPDRARIIRRGGVEIPEAGEHEIILGALPQDMEQESLRVSGHGTAGALLLGVDLSAEFHEAAPVAETQRIQAEIDRLTRELATLDQRATLLDKQRGWLNALGEHAARSLAYGLIRGTAQPADQERIFAVTRDESERLTAEALDVQRERQRVAQELEARRRELEAAGAVSRPDRLRAVIRVRAASAGTLDLEASYLTHDASWSAQYDARVDIEASVARFTQQAAITQWSGEDWGSVELAVSTARPSATVSLPDDAPVWYLDQWAPQPRPRFAAAAPMRGITMKAPADMAGGAAVEAMAAPMEEPADMLAAPATVESAGVAQIFRVGGGMNIPSDGQPHLVGLGDDELPARLEYVAAPVVAEGAHLRAVTLNATGHALPAGTLRVFHGGAAGDEYVGETHLKPTAEGAQLKLYLGVNDNFTVKRELVERDTDKGNLLQGGVRKTTIGYRVTIANHTDKEQRVILMDRLPTPKHERIKVKTLEIRPQPTSQTKLDQLTWETQMGAGEERRIEWRFLVESPADMDVAGMP